jgi:Cytochrome oxidase complex assembly protein 1
MDDKAVAWETEFEVSGRTWIGNRKASGSFVKLRARADDLSITTPIVRISFSPREVVAFKPSKGVFGYGGFEIVHTVDGRNVQFWCRDADTVLQRIAATGFVPRGTPRGGPDPARRARHEEDSGAGNRGAFKLVAIILAFFAVIFVPLGLFAYFSADSNGVLESTRAAVQTDPRVLAVTGSPVTTGRWSGSIQSVGSGGTASVKYDVTGPNGKGTVDAAGTRESSVWHVDRFVFTPDGEPARAMDLTKPP